jgi:hypothetical protein
MIYMARYELCATKTSFKWRNTIIAPLKVARKPQVLMLDAGGMVRDGGI